MELVCIEFWSEKTSTKDCNKMIPLEIGARYLTPNYMSWRDMFATITHAYEITSVVRKLWLVCFSVTLQGCLLSIELVSSLWPNYMVSIARSHAFDNEVYYSLLVLFLWKNVLSTFFDLSGNDTLFLKQYTPPPYWSRVRPYNLS